MEKEEKKLTDAEIWASLYQKILYWQADGYDVTAWLDLVKSFDIHRDLDKILAITASIETTLGEKWEIITKAKAETEKEIVDSEEDEILDFIETRHMAWAEKRKRHG